MIPLDLPPPSSTPARVRGMAALAASLAAVLTVGSVQALAAHYAVETELARATSAQWLASAPPPCGSVTQVHAARRW